MDIQESLHDALRVHEKMSNDVGLQSALRFISDSLVNVYASGGKLLIAGNGGSAADAQHFAAEIVCQYREKRRGRPALALSVDTSALTAWGNDHSFDTVFSRQLEAFGNPGDVLIVISTSGNSKNLIAAAEAARTIGIQVVGLLGGDGGKLLPLCDHVLVVPSRDTARIQEGHILLIHILCDALDTFFFKDDQKRAG